MLGSPLVLFCGDRRLQIEYRGGECHETYEVYLYSGLCEGQTGCIGWDSDFWTNFGLADDAANIWPSAGVLVATSVAFAACATVMTGLSAVQLVSLRFGQLALLSNTSITFLCLLAGLTLVTTSDSVDPDMWKPIRDKLEHNFDITYTCDTIVSPSNPIGLATTALVLQAATMLFMAFPGCFGYLPGLVYYPHVKIRTAMDEFEDEDEEMKL